MVLSDSARRSRGSSLCCPDDAKSSDVLRMRCSGVRDLVIENVTGGAICRVLVSDIGAWGWEGVRYVFEAEDSVKFYCEDLLADVVQSA